MRRSTWYILGVGTGLVVPKLVPKLHLVQAVKYFKEAVHARKRLQKIAIEEYYRLDDAIDAELKLLDMINPHVIYTDIVKISFEVQNASDGGRTVTLSMRDKPRNGD